MAQVKLILSEFTQEETDQFNKTWISMVSIWNREGLVLLFTDADKQLVMAAAMAFKFKRDDEDFAGSNPVDNNQYGMRWSLAESMLQDDAAAPLTRVLDWHQANLLTTSGWATGRRNWISSQAANTGSFDVGDGEVILTDPNTREEFWSQVVLFIQEQNPDPIGKQLLMDLNRQPQVPVNFRWHMTSSEFQIMKLDNAIIIQDDMPFRFGIETILPPGVDNVESTFVAGSVEFFSNRRALTDNTAVAFPRPFPN